MAKDIKYGEEVKAALKAGINKVADAVGTTLGPKGRNVLINKGWGTPDVTKDGYTVAKEIQLSDPIEDTAAQLVKQTAMKTNELAGDGPQPLYSKVLTPEGFVRMGDLKVGDQICGTNQTIQSVVAVYPKGTKQVFKIKFFDGKEVECCEDHLWNVTTNWGKNKILTVRQMIANGITYGKSNKNHRFFSPVSKAEFSKKEMPLDPYLVGLLIGDGALSGTGSIELSLGPNDGYILDKIRLPKGLYLKTTFVEHKHYYRVKIQGKTPDNKSIFNFVEEIGLLGTKSATKFIPKNYLYSDYNSRLELLEGLTDTDGHTNTRKMLEYSTISAQLASDVMELLRGLGKTARLRLHVRKENSSYSSTSIYRIGEMKGYKYGNCITAIEPTDKYVEMQCIKVSNPDNLYFTNDYAITHNTTTSTLLAQAIVNLGFEVLNDNCNATLLKKGIDNAILEVNDYLSSIKTDISLDNKELVEYIATISANDSAAGKIVAEAYQSVGEGGVVVLEKEKNSVETVIKKFDGFEIDRGYLSPWFATKDEVCELENPYVLLWDKRLSNMTDTQELMALLEKIVANKASLVLVSEDVEGDALATMVLNKTRGVISCVAVKSPGFGDRSQNLMSDLAVFLNCTDFSKKPGAKLDKIQISELGKCNKVIITKATTTFIGGDGAKEDVDSRIALLKKEYLESESNYDRDKINERIGKLTSSIAVIKLGAHTEAEMKEKHYRFEDAISATRAALTYGIVPGGGMALLFAAKNISESYSDPDEDKGLQVIKEALASPFNKILTNAGKDPNSILKNLKDTPYYGYDVKNDKYGDMLNDLGVIDPVYVTQSAVANAGAIGGIFLTTEAIIVNSPEPK